MKFVVVLLVLFSCAQGEDLNIKEVQELVKDLVDFEAEKSKDIKDISSMSRQEQEVQGRKALDSSKTKEDNQALNIIANAKEVPQDKQELAHLSGVFANPLEAIKDLTGGACYFDLQQETDKQFFKEYVTETETEEELSQKSCIVQIDEIEEKCERQIKKMTCERSLRLTCDGYQNKKPFVIHANPKIKTSIKNNILEVSQSTIFELGSVQQEERQAVAFDILNKEKITVFKVVNIKLEDGWKEQGYSIKVNGVAVTRGSDIGSLIVNGGNELEIISPCSIRVDQGTRGFFRSCGAVSITMDFTYQDIQTCSKFHDNWEEKCEIQ